MSKNRIKNYLDTQGLHLSVNDVELSHSLINTIVNLVGQEDEKEVEYSIFNLMPSINHQLSDKIAFKHLISKLLIGLNSTHSRFPVDAVAIYTLAEKVALNISPLSESSNLIQLCCVGQELPNSINVNSIEETSSDCDVLVARCAQTKWLYATDDINQLINNPLIDKTIFYPSQLVVPVVDDNDDLLAIVWATKNNHNGFGEEEMINWIALAIAIAPVITSYSEKHNQNSF